MKYIMLSDGEGLDYPVFCVAPRTHSELATAWRRDERTKVVSAGFCEFVGDGEVKTSGFSTSLNMGPRAQDARIISAFYRASLGKPPGVKS